MPRTRSAPATRERSPGRAPGRWVAALAALFVALGALVAVATPAAAGVTVPQSAMDGRWSLGGNCYGTAACAAWLSGRTFTAHNGLTDCRGGRLTWRDLPSRPTTNVVYYGTLSTFELVQQDGRTVCAARSVRYQYKFWWEGSDTGAREYLKLEVARLDSQYSHWFRHRVGNRDPICRTGQTVNRSFTDPRGEVVLANPRVFTVQFTSLSYCFDGTRVWFQDRPELRLYAGPSARSRLQAACAGVPGTDPDRRLSSVYVTCNAVFSNRSVTSYIAVADYDSGTGSRFRIPAQLNASVNLGPSGSVSLPSPADPSRYYTLRLYPNGCHEVSGVGDARQYC